jgi:flavin-binding protein dodecin
MSVAKVTEITARSPESFQHAMERGIDRVEDTIHNVKSAWVKDQKVTCDEHGIDEYHVDLKVTFILDD